jgi:hypothetical protein
LGFSSYETFQVERGACTLARKAVKRVAGECRGRAEHDVPLAFERWI